MKLDLGPDAWGSYNSTLHVNSDGTFTTSFSGDNVAHEEFRKRARNDGSNGFAPSRELRKIIELGMEEVMLIATLHGVQPLSKAFDEVVLRLARDSDWKAIKTVEGGIRTKMSIR